MRNLIPAVAAIIPALASLGIFMNDILLASPTIVLVGVGYLIEGISTRMRMCSRLFWRTQPSVTEQGGTRRFQTSRCFKVIWPLKFSLTTSKVL